jgi:hypothetical protein
MSSSPSRAPDLTVAPALLPRAVGGVGTSVVAGLAVGVASWLSDELGHPVGLLIPANLIGVWLGLAFALGTTARTVPTGALRGLIGLLSAVLGYYVLNALLGDGYRAIGASHAATVWGVVALGMGPLLGLAGGTWRHAKGWGRAGAVALLSAALVAEGLVFGAPRFIRGDPFADVGALVFLGEAVIGLALPLVLLRAGERILGIVLMIALAVGAAVAIGPVTALIRGLADRF